MFSTRPSFLQIWRDIVTLMFDEYKLQGVTVG